MGDMMFKEWDSVLRGHLSVSLLRNTYKQCFQTAVTPCVDMIDDSLYICFNGKTYYFEDIGKDMIIPYHKLALEKLPLWLYHLMNVFYEHVVVDNNSEKMSDDELELLVEISCL